MIYASISGDVASGKLNEAAAYLGKYAETIKKITGHDVQVLGEVGELNKVMTVTTYDSLADMEKTIEDCWSNEEYRKLMDSAQGLFENAETRIMKETG